MASVQDGKLHVVFLPFYTPSHMVPLVNVARLFAARGVQSTIITSEQNALIVKPSVDSDADSGYPISIVTLKFPSSQVGLPEGIENFSSITSREMATQIFHGIMLLRNPTEQLVRELNPSCIFSDMFYPWSVDLADELRIPRLMFYPSNLFYLSLFRSLKLHSPQDDVKLETESFVVPGIPDRIEMKRSQLEESLKANTRYGEMIDAVMKSESRSLGTVHDTFYDLEPAYAEHHKKVTGLKFWTVGPLFQYFNSGELSSPEKRKHGCLSWLDSREPNSVLYVCFGSIVRFQEAQLTEIAMALEECGFPFVWVIRKGAAGEGPESFLPEGFEERISRDDRGIIVRGWVPQVKILEHPSVGGFMTHCGWNSILEAIIAAVPLVTWPLCAEQFYNEKLVEHLRIGVGVGADVCNPTFYITSPIRGKDSIREAVCKLMGASEEAQEIRRLANELAVKARDAVKHGGSSYDNLTALINEIKNFKFVGEIA